MYRNRGHRILCKRWHCTCRAGDGGTGGAAATKSSCTHRLGCFQALQEAAHFFDGSRLQVPKRAAIRRSAARTYARRTDEDVPLQESTVDGNLAPRTMVRLLQPPLGPWRRRPERTCARRTDGNFHSHSSSAESIRVGCTRARSVDHCARLHHDAYDMAAASATTAAYVLE